MDYEKRFFEHLIQTYLHVLSITRDEAILKIKKLKEDEPKKYQDAMNEWFDIVHPH